MLRGDTAPEVAIRELGLDTPLRALAAQDREVDLAAMSPRSAAMWNQ